MSSCSSRTVFTDKQQLATDLAASPRTVLQTNRQWCKLVSARCTEFHVPHGQTNLNLHFICAHGHDHGDLHRQSLQNVFQATGRFDASKQSSVP